MLCPSCQVDLHMTERQGVEIDYCPKCRGVWLDRGELDKIIERSRAEMDAAPGAPPAPAQPAVAYAPPPPMPPQPGYPPQGGYYKDGRYWQDERQYQEHKKRRKRSFFEDLFD